MMKGTVMNKTHRLTCSSVVLALGLMVLGSGHLQAEGLTHQAVQVNTPQILNLTVGESKIVETGAPFKRASVANPDVADQIVLSTKQVYLAGKAVGTTTLTLWGQGGEVSNVFNVQVSPDINRLKEQIHTLMPNETGIKVMSSHEHITLAGSVSDMGSLNKVLSRWPSC